MRSELYRQGEPWPFAIVLLDGWIGLRVTLPDGSCHITDVALPGAVLGTQPEPGRPMNHTAFCLTDVTVCVLPRDDLGVLVRRNAEFERRLARALACREARIQDHFVNISGRGARERVAHLLMELFYRSRRRFPASGDVVRIPLTQAHLGQALSLSEVHVSRVLTMLRVQGVAEFVRHKLTVLDACAFKRAANFESDLWAYDDEDDARLLAQTAPQQSLAEAGPLSGVN